MYDLTRKLMFLALHGPLKTTGFTKNVSLGIIRVGFPVSELHVWFHAFKNAYNIYRWYEKILRKWETQTLLKVKLTGKLKKESTWESSVVPSPAAP